MPEDTTQEPSFVDRMAQDDDPLASLRAEESGAADATDNGKGADSGAAPAAAAPNPEFTELKTEFGKLRDEVFAKGQEIAYLRGERAREQRDTKPQQPEAPKPFQFDKDRFAAELEKDGPEAIYRLMQQMQESGQAITRHEVDQRIAGQATETQRRQAYDAAMDRDKERTSKDFGEYIAQVRGSDGKMVAVNPEFDGEAMGVLREMMKERGIDRLIPGDLYAAASAVYARWARAGKLNPPKQETAPAAPRSLRQIIDQVPRSDNLGSNGNGRSARTSTTPKTLDDLLGTTEYPTQKHVDAARNVCRRNGWDEGRFVANVLEAQRNGEFD